MGELVGSSALLGDGEKLRRRMATAAGYLFLRGLLDPEPIRRASAEILEMLQEEGRLGADGSIAPTVPGRVPRSPSRTRRSSGGGHTRR